MCQIKVCGIDLLKKKDQWIILEINAEPSFRFFEEEQKNIIGEVLDFLVKESREK